MYQSIVEKCKAISFNVLIAVSFLLPFFFLPATVAGFSVVKGVILYAGVFLSVSFWLVSQFVQGSLDIPRSRVFLLLAIWGVLSLVSALTSPDMLVSLWGKGFALDSFATSLVLALYVFMVATFAREQRRLFKLFLGGFAASVLTIVLQVALYLSQNIPFIANSVSHVANQGTLLGSWVDFTYFVTFTLIVGLLMYEVLMPKGLFKHLSLLAILVSLACLIFLNFTVAWLITIAAALIVFVYKSSVERALMNRMKSQDNTLEETGGDSEVKQKFPLLSFITLLVGLFFFLSANSVGLFLSRSAGVSFTNVRPSFNTTTNVMWQSIKADPLFGAGAGSYTDVWNKYRPLDVNRTIFWNTPFDIGFNYIQSVITTTGLLPSLALIALFVMTIIHGFRLFNASYPDRFSRFIAVMSLIIVIAITLLLFFGTPGLVLLAIGFFYVGMLFGVSSLVGKTEVKKIEYLKDPRLSFFAILGIVVLAMVGFSAVYFSGNKFVSVVYYNKALAATNIANAERFINQAITLSETDEYWRARAALYINEFTKLAGTENPDTTRLQALFTQAEQSARQAVALNSRSTTNWLLLSQVYQLVAGGQNNTDALTNAQNALAEAQKRNPFSPFLTLTSAQVALLAKDTAGAKTAIEKAIELKNDYLDAYILKGQIEEETTPGALKNTLLKYTTTASFNSEGYLVLGNIYLNEKDYDRALEAFARARALDPGTPTAYLSYISALEASGNTIRAIEELKAFQSRFPRVGGIEGQIERLQGKRSTPPPTDTETSTAKE